MTGQIKPRSAATLMLARDSAEGIELFMVVRHHEIEFASGALVFPGGSVSQLDFDPRWRKLAEGVTGVDDEMLGLMAAAARERLKNVAFFSLASTAVVPWLMVREQKRWVSLIVRPSRPGHLALLT